MTEPYWTPPEEAVCMEQGCTLPPVGVRPNAQPLIVEDDQGRAFKVFDVGEVDEVVCAQHMEGSPRDDQR